MLEWKESCIGSTEKQIIRGMWDTDRFISSPRDRIYQNPNKKMSRDMENKTMA